MKKKTEKTLEDLGKGAYNGAIAYADLRRDDLPGTITHGVRAGEDVRKAYIEVKSHTSTTKDGKKITVRTYRRKKPVKGKPGDRRR